MRRLRPRALLIWSGIAVSLVCAYFAVRDVDLAALSVALRETDYWVLLPAAAVLAVAIYVRAIRWRLLLSPASRPSTNVVTSALLIGYLFNSILPARAGEAARVVALNQRAGTSRFEALGTVAAERALDVLALLALFFAAAPFLPRADWLDRALLLGATLFVVLLVLLVAFALWGERPARLLLRPLAVLPRLSRERMELAARNLVHGFALFRSPRVAAPAVALTLASWLLVAVGFWLCTLGFPIEVGFAAGLLVVIATNLALILPSGPAAVGVFEAATIVALRPFGVPHAPALSYALVLHALNVFPLIVAGYVALHLHARAIRRRTRGEGARIASESRVDAESELSRA